MSPNSLPEGTDTILDGAGGGIDDIDMSGAAPMDSGAAEDVIAAGGDEGAPGFPVDDEPAAAAASAATAGEAFKDAKAKASQKAQDFKGQATDKLRAYAVGGKDKASESINGLAKLLEDAAAQIDEKVGAQYGGYARNAAQTISGFASTLDEKDVDELFEQGRELVRKSPGVAIGAAAAIGFVVARLARSGIDASATTGTTGPGNERA